MLARETGTRVERRVEARDDCEKRRSADPFKDVFLAVSPNESSARLSLLSGSRDKRGRREEGERERGRESG